MNCRNSINVTKQLGFYRSILLSFLFGLISFIVLYLPITLIHKDVVVTDPGFIPTVLGLFLLPISHKFLRALPILFLDNQTKQKVALIPVFHFPYGGQANKYIISLTLMTPTLLVTIPFIAGSYLLAEYYPFFVLGASINLSLSFIHFLSLKQLWKAPKKSIIAKDKEHYDILIP